MNSKGRDIDYVDLDDSRCHTISLLFPGSGYHCRTGYHMRRLNQAVPPVGIACMIALHQCSEADLGVRGKLILGLALIANHQKDPNRTLYRPAVRDPSPASATRPGSHDASQTALTRFSSPTAT